MNNFHALSNGNGHIEQKSSVKNVAARSPWPLNVPVKIIGGGGQISLRISSSETQGQSVGKGEKVQQKFSSMLENFCRASSPGPTDCPWVSEDVRI